MDETYEGIDRGMTHYVGDTCPGGHVDDHTPEPIQRLRGALAEMLHQFGEYQDLSIKSAAIQTARAVLDDTAPADEAVT